MTPKQIEDLTKALLELNDYTQFHSDSRGADNSKAIILTYKREVPVGHYFLCDCEGNTVDLCFKTKRKFKNRDGRVVHCKVLKTIIPDARKQLGSPVNGCWQIPYHLF